MLLQNIRNTDDNTPNFAKPATGMVLINNETFFFKLSIAVSDITTWTSIVQVVSFTMAQKLLVLKQ